MPETPHDPPPQCHIHDEVADLSVDGIHEKVCVGADLHPLVEFDGRHYCLFHLPAKDKDVVKFESIFRARLDAVKQRAFEIEMLLESERANAKERLSYDFRYVWFPLRISLSHYSFLARSNFHSATFASEAFFNSAVFLEDAHFKFVNFFGETSFGDTTFSANAFFDSARFLAVANFGSAKVLSDADFSSATFSAAANFYSATFSAGANFRLAKFSTRINFRLATFSAGANFRLATFSAYAGFNSATFSADADFSSATFSGETHFDSAKFGKIVETRFYYANFAGDTFFDDAEFNEDVSFNSAIFGEDSDVFFRRTVFAGNADFQYCTSEGYLRFSDLQLRSRSRFDFQEAAFEKASRVSFHTISLRPHWFVNVDSRKFVFTDILWKNLDWDFWNKNIYAEIDSLPETGAAKQKKRIFEIAARQLAVNAEENNRYEEAAKFRYMAMETRRLEETKHFRASRLLMWLYKWSSGYGESWSRAALVLLFIWLGFGLVYWQFGSFQIETPLDVWQSLGYSSQVMLLQKPNPRPLSNLTFTLYVLETIFAPLQAALLALAIRRKFMR